MLLYLCRESADNDIIELVHIVNVPTEAFNKRPPCRYKYCVFSDAVTEFMKSPFEFIYGNARDGNPIDRLLLLNTQYINKTGKELTSVYNNCDHLVRFSIVLGNL